MFVVVPTSDRTSTIRGMKPRSMLLLSAGAQQTQCVRCMRTLLARAFCCIRINYGQYHHNIYYNILTFIHILYASKLDAYTKLTAKVGYVKLSAHKNHVISCGTHFLFRQQQHKQQQHTHIHRALSSIFMNI